MRGGTGLIRRPEFAACELSNRFLMMIKNDSIGLVLCDWYPVLRRTARDVVVNAIRNPRACGDHGPSGSFPPPADFPGG